MIEAMGLNKRFGSIEAARDVSFVARDDEITGLLGANGAGKSTCLRVLYGGSYGTRVAELYMRRYPAHVHAVILDGVTYPQQAIGVETPQDAERALNLIVARCVQTSDCAARTAELSLALGMDAFIERRAKGFSQGQRIKVALARALVHDPGNVVLDEPTNGLDVMAIRNLREMLLALKAQGRCVLFSSHVMQEVAALCDRVVIIGHGRVLADATVQEIRERSGTATLEEAFLQVLGDTEGVS